MRDLRFCRAARGPCRALFLVALVVSACGQRGDLLGTIAGPLDGGEAGVALSPSYLIGADITFVAADEAAGATYSDGAERDILQLLRDHGFGAIRLRTFVDPSAADGYDKQNGSADLAHTIAFARRVKAAGMAFLLNFHYSDNWADPGKQCVPLAWQGMTFDQMLQALRDYTRNAVAQLVAAGARPDIVQLGNEITPGMLIHLCDENGLPTGTSAINGSALNWGNLGQLLKAAVAAVEEVDASIRIMLHIDRGGDKPTDDPGYALRTSVGWVEDTLAQGVRLDILGESAYQRYQGDPGSEANTAATWSSTFSGLAARFPGLKIMAVEYGPMQRQINDIVFDLPNQQGVGTFVWEPTRQGTWNTGHALFAASGTKYTATPDLALYDAMKAAYSSRL
ncbi:MAG: glycosyl hydrolase 53 family protein [Deltaproteobacteria bacterium]|nr:glycosyl hydrolase 53 family protein [Deltaproteobacteria bacterium]